MAQPRRAFSTLRDALRAVINPLGLDVVRYLSPNTLEGHLHRLLPSLDVNCVLDVGAHHGEFAKLLRGIGYRSRIVSFEPVSTNLDALRRARGRDAEWRVVPLALGAEPSVMAINVLAATDLSSFLTPTTGAEAWFGSGSRVVRTEAVRVERLDDIIDVYTDALASPRIFLKLDTQGFDATVLQGARQTLKHVVGLQTEIAVRALYEGVPLFPENVRALLDLGFELTGLFGVAHEPDWIAQIEFDCVMRRPSSGRPR